MRIRYLPFLLLSVLMLLPGFAYADLGNFGSGWDSIIIFEIVAWTLFFVNLILCLGNMIWKKRSVVIINVILTPLFTTIVILFLFAFCDVACSENRKTILLGASFLMLTMIELLLILLTIKKIWFSKGKQNTPTP